MAKINLGILDGFIGKVGNVVGSFWKGKAVMRGYTRSVHNPHTDAQEAVRKRFVAISKLSSALRGALLAGLGDYAREQQVTECNSFVRLNFGAVTVDGSGVVSINYSALETAKGPLPKATFGQADFSTSQRVTVPFEGNSQSNGARGNDDIYLLVYSPDIDAAVLSTPARRSATEVVCEVPAGWTGLTVHVWGFATGAQGTAQQKQSSDSAYIGTGEIE